MPKWPFRRKQKSDTVAKKAKAAAAVAVGLVAPISKTPDVLYGDLFDDVQRAGIFQDNKSFVDMVSKTRAAQLQKLYAKEREKPTFHLESFVRQHFASHEVKKTTPAIRANTARKYIAQSWGRLQRDNRRNVGSLIGLPYSYVVPGGRFQEQFYWDTYFIMLGLAADNHWDLIRGMVRNYCQLVRRFQFIPTANRTYFLSRSQPPFFALMLRLLGRHYGQTKTYIEFLPYLAIEYRFWMKGRRALGDHPECQAVRRVVRMPNGAVLNRYFDNKTTPRPEMAKEDIDSAEFVPPDEKERMYVDLRAGAESGWDFSSRWFKDNLQIQTIHTTDIVPVDLNCLLYMSETTQAEALRLLKQPLLAARMQAVADKRATTIRRYMWNQKTGFYHDYDFVDGTMTEDMTLAGVFPLYARIATTEQAASVARHIEEKFLYQGGLVTTLTNSGQQWDSPNGWAPLQWIAVKGLREYGYHQLADTVRDRWLALNDKVYTQTRTMVEKYDVVSCGVGGGGEYGVQDGFGWTNGVYAALHDERAIAS